MHVRSGADRASAAHDGYRALPGSPVHARLIERMAGGSFRIVDEVTGAGSHGVRSALRVHPALAARLEGEDRVLLEGDGLRVALVRESGPPFALEDGWYFPRMGERVPCSIVVQRAEASLPVRLACRIEKLVP